MPAGRPPKQSQLKSLQGTDRKDRKVETLKVDTFDNVEELKAINLKGLESALAKKVFNEKANILLVNKMLCPQDLDQLVIYANSYDHLTKAAKEMKKGMVLETFNDDGTIKGYIANPYIKIYKMMFDIVSKIGSEFGFTPLSRMKIHFEEKKEEDPLQKLLNEFNS